MTEFNPHLPGTYCQRKQPKCFLSDFSGMLYLITVEPGGKALPPAYPLYAQSLFVHVSQVEHGLGVLLLFGGHPVVVRRRLVVHRGAWSRGQRVRTGETVPNAAIRETRAYMMKVKGLYEKG